MNNRIMITFDTYMLMNDGETQEQADVRLREAFSRFVNAEQSNGNDIRVRGYESKVFEDKPIEPIPINYELINELAEEMKNSNEYKEFSAELDKNRTK